MSLRATVPKTPLYAMLGPTNTGKTHYAMERMTSFKTGMIGFPLRLLARENYDKLVAQKGRHSVALITGEEKIIPPQPRYYICTVESMPISLRVDFLCVDEIQLCADAERGHIFTDRLLHARGEEETLFLGSLTIEPLIKRLLPNCRIETRERLSPLTFTGYRKLTRLPPRSAIVAFNVNDVYRLAEFLRQHRGGTAIVLGALSPRARNAQVALYQNGDVDYLVATDAIGMGLNMDINHVALAATRKFDGQKARYLRSDELAQIAGRAGRFRSPGTFGVTDQVHDLEESTVRSIESHQFEMLTQIRWRNPDLDYHSLDALLKSLNKTPQQNDTLGNCFIPARQADDHTALKSLSMQTDIRAIADSRAMIRLLWDVCAIPDFRKSLADEHHRLLGQIFMYLAHEPHRLPEDWCAEQIKRLDRYDGDLDTLLNRIAYIRTWTYITHVKGWMFDAEHWQAVTRQIEDKLSDALHERLTQRFVDKRTSTLLRGLANRDKLSQNFLGGVTPDGTVIIEGHVIGRLQGWHFMADTTLQEADEQALMKAARAVLKEPLARAIDVFAQQVSAAFTLQDNGTLLWRSGESHFPIARLTKGQSLYQPQIILLHNDMLEDAQNKIVLERLQTWLDDQFTTTLASLNALKTPPEETKGAVKGIAFQVHENIGLMVRQDLNELITTLDKDDRQALHKMGIKLGAFYVYQRDMLKPAALHLKAVLWRLFHDIDAANTPLPQSGNVSMACPENAPRSFYLAMGFPVFGKTCVRVDMIERLNSAIYDGAVDGKYTFDPALASTVGVHVDTIQFILHDLGFRYDEVTEKVTQKVKEGEGDAAVEVEKEVDVTKRLYHVRRKPPRIFSPSQKPGAVKKDSTRKAGEKVPFNKLDSSEKPKFKGKKSERSKPNARSAETSVHSASGVTGHNPFAELLAKAKK